MNEITKMKLYPSIEDVFINPQPYYKYVFFPLLSVQLCGKEWLHFVSVYGDGNPEIPQPDSFAKYCFAKFTRIDDKYRFDGAMDWIENYIFFSEWYNEAENEYAIYHTEYLQAQTRESATISLYTQNKKKRMKENEDRAYYVDSLLNYWITRDKYIETGKFIQGNHYTGNYSGQEREILGIPSKDDIEYTNEMAMRALTEFGESIEDMSYIGYVKGYNFMDDGEDSINLYLSNDGKEVLLFFNWS